MHSLPRVFQEQYSTSKFEEIYKPMVIHDTQLAMRPRSRTRKRRGAGVFQGGSSNSLGLPNMAGVQDIAKSQIEDS